MGKTEKGQIIFDTTGGDVWTWQKEISGRCTCGDKCGAISVQVNGVEAKVEQKGDRFSALVQLAEGRNQIVASCRHGEGRKCSSEEIDFIGCLKRMPTARIRVGIESEGVVLDGGGSSPAEPDGTPIVKYIWSARKDNPSPIPIRYSLGRDKDKAILLGMPKADGEYYFSLKVVDAEGKSDTSTTYFVVEKGKPRLVKWETENPAWVDNAVIYGVVPHNFGPLGFRSVTDKLDYLKDLGINAFWLSPCTETPTGVHGYAVGDYFNLRKDYGTKADFKKMVAEAHARGIRVLMDFVPNHSSIQHRYMRHSQAHGKASRYYDFYDRDKDDGFHTFYFHWTYLPNINYENPEARRWMTEAFSYWVREFDVDGFRVDVAWGIRERRPDYWPEWRRELKRIKPDLLLLAEASARDPYYFDQGFDAAYDWTDQLGKWAWEKVFIVPNRIVLRLNAALTNEGRGFHPDALIFRFMNNNDTEARFITRYGLKMEKVAAALLLTLPGAPCVYTGQEVGAEFEPYTTIHPISWQDKHGLRGYYRKLIALRKRMPSLHSRKFQILKADSMQQVFAYIRYGAAGDPPVLVVLNFSDPKDVNGNPARVRLHMPKEFPEFARSGYLVDLLKEEHVPIRASEEDGDIQMSVAPLSAHILKATGDKKAASK